jgi:hypothetical protein
MATSRRRRGGYENRRIEPVSDVSLLCQALTAVNMRRYDALGNGRTEIEYAWQLPGVCPTRDFGL